MSDRPKHPKPPGEQLLRLIEAHGWTVEKRNYFWCLCPCGRHYKTVHLSPSDPNYWRNTKGAFERFPCWGP